MRLEQAFFVTSEGPNVRAPTSAVLPACVGHVPPGDAKIWTHPHRFLRKMCNVTVLALVLFSVGVIVFVLSFVVEASEELGVGWLAVLGFILCPTMLAGLMFVISTVQVRRHSMESVPARPRQ